MEYRTTTKQDAIWALLREAERKHVAATLDVLPEKVEIEILEATIARLKKALKETEI